MKFMCFELLNKVQGRLRKLRTGPFASMGILALLPLFAQAADVLTQHNDNVRLGANLNETLLRPTNVRPGLFGRLYERQVKGQIITQPLYVSNLVVSGRPYNVVYVATRENWVYAFDADNTDPDPSAGVVWAVQLQPAGPVPDMCPETHGPMGITSTPVIDRTSGTMYAVARNSNGSIWLHALDIVTGKPKAGTPGAVKIGPIVKDSIPFAETTELNRAGLLLQNGVLFLAFGALNCDNMLRDPAGWHGWVLAYRASNLTFADAFVTTHSGEGGGVWQSGNGLVADDAGSIYFETGNGPAGSNTDLGESFVKLRLGPAPFYGLFHTGHYTVSNFAALNRGDTDIGSGGPVLLPGGRLVGGGKQGKLYVLDSQTMKPSQNGPSSGPVPPGGSDGFQAFINTWHDDNREIACTDPLALPLPGRICYVPHHQYEEGERGGPNIHGAPIYWNLNPSYGLLYAMPEKDHLRAFRYDCGSRVLSTVPERISTVRSPDGMPGAALSLSANLGTDGIIWASVPKYDGQWENVPGRLLAFDAITLDELWRDDDDIGFSKFTSVTVADGKVFRPTFADKLIVYGPKSGPDPSPCSNIAQKYKNYTGAEGLLGTTTSPETPTPDGIGRYQHFQNGSIYWSPSTCAQEVHGTIHDKWASLGWERSVLGYPTADATVTPDGIGLYNHFQGGSVYWTPLTGAYEVHGAIRERWAALGWERSALGYPISDGTDERDGSGRFNLFEHGSIHWNRATGTVTVFSNPAILISPQRGNIDRLGSDITNFALPAANPTMCQQACTDNDRCRSWTYVNPGVQGPQARCWLKGAIPLEQSGGCCVSGIKVDVHPANTVNLQGAVDRPGFDFADFDLPNNDYRLCQGECAANGICRAWTYVEARPAHCWLKNAVPASADNLCCVSGAK